MEQSVKVLQVFGKMTRGGAETMLMNLYRHLDFSLIQFDFVVHQPGKGDYDEEIISLGGKIYCAPAYTFINHFRYIGWWNDFFVHHPEYGIVHSHIRSTANLILRSASKRGLYTIAHSHSTSNGKGLSSLVKRMYQKSIPKYADQLFACSQEAGRWLFGNRPFLIVKNAVDSKDYAYCAMIREDVRKSLCMEDKSVIGHIGRFMKAKNHLFLIDIFSCIHRMLPAACLLLIGEGELKKTVERKVSALGLEGSVSFAGIRDDVPDLLQAMDAFVLPSRYEGLPLVLIEAQAAGLPCIVSDCITEEIAVTDLTRFVSLDEQAQTWAEVIVDRMHGNDRVNRQTEIMKAGYDAEDNARWLQDFYLTCNVKRDR